MNVVHADASISRTPLACDDEDRLDLLRRVSASFEKELLAYCLMDTHLHVVAECGEKEAREALHAVLRGYTRYYNTRYDLAVGVRRGSVNVLPKPTAREVARAIKYDHQNPVRPRIVAHELDYEWSSARAFAGLTCRTIANVERTRTLIRSDEGWALPSASVLEGVEKVSSPTASVELILAATAQAFGLSAPEVASDLRGEDHVAARVAFMVLGRLEGYVDRQLAVVIGRSRVRANTLVPEDDAVEREHHPAVRVVRTLLRRAATRARLEKSLVGVLTPSR